ncbi:MAG: acyl-CoA dehydrogenase [Deltaproteobacteria bacterium]|nr:acyl-CoA dehydrogenase [Deltaproteobacteria bacterium]MBW1736646.1 acyl-CoA dehydrogenase [Deltaproteobacteria bacterium]MBW1909440.1 acyl-CoA dehydrogenase [Deltaproteobacteria bacterium]MBW2032735.1 acyl-CoA dehydrogenase [Deltaproteobacteria bacterium]MBW2113556.1 acyl-CoA dehydrogenase [Deltaproteobacteria bacterium]
MNFDFDKTEKTLRDKINGLFDPDSKAALANLENGDIDEVREATLNCSKILGQAGYMALGLDDGKNGASLTATQESLAVVSPSLFLSVEVSARVFGRLVAVYGTPDQEEKILLPMKEGLLIGTVAISEGGMNIENDPLDTAGVSSDDGFRVSGSKGHVVNGPIADWIAVAGKVGDEIGFFLIKKDSEGMSIGQRLTTLGYNGVTISAVTLENCHVPSTYIIGPFEGEEQLKTVRRWEDQALTAASLGQIQRSFDTALNYAKNHKSGGKPIIAYQEVGFKLAEMLTLLQTAQLLAYRAAWMADTGDREAAVLAHCAKVFCTESSEKVASYALQILGGQGYISGNPAEEGYRESKYLQIAGTSSEISRMKIADNVLMSQ